MTIRNYFKKTRKSESERQKSLHDPEQALAWMEELFRLGTALDLKFPGSGIIGHLDALNLVDILRDKGLAKEVPVVVMRRRQDARLALAAKAGKVTMLVDRPVDFAGTVKPAMERMLGLNDSASLSHPYAS